MKNFLAKIAAWVFEHVLIVFPYFKKQKQMIDEAVKKVIADRRIEMTKRKLRGAAAKRAILKRLKDAEVVKAARIRRMRKGQRNLKLMAKTKEGKEADYVKRYRRIGVLEDVTIEENSMTKYKTFFYILKRFPKFKKFDHVEPVFKEEKEKVYEDCHN